MADTDTLTRTRGVRRANGMGWLHPDQESSGFLSLAIPAPA